MTFDDLIKKEEEKIKKIFDNHKISYEDAVRMISDCEQKIRHYNQTKEKINT